VLALSTPRVVSANALLDALWPDDPPEGGPQALHTHISRLRRALGPAAGRLERVAAGYRLDLGPGELDLGEAQELAREVTTELGSHPGRAAELAARALKLWRGPALAEFAAVEPLAARAVAVEDLHRQLQHQAVAARLELGDATVTRDAAALAAADPLHEPSTLLWVRALAAEGRSAEAMRVAAEFRRRLADETGLDPSPQLAELEQRVASGAVAVRAGHAARRLVSRPLGPLEGREHDRSELERLLGAHAAVTVTGPGGGPRPGSSSRWPPI
jgi:DNA-binding SARP family transcriptional activator